MTKENLKDYIDTLPEDLYKSIVGITIVGSDGHKNLASRCYVDYYYKDDYQDKYGKYPNYLTMVKTIFEMVNLAALKNDIELTHDETWEITWKIEKTILNELLKKK